MYLIFLSFGAFSFKPTFHVLVGYYRNPFMQKHRMYLIGKDFINFFFKKIEPRRAVLIIITSGYN